MQRRLSTVYLEGANFWIDQNFWNSFFKTFYEVIACANKDILLKVGYQKICYYLNKKRTNE